MVRLEKYEILLDDIKPTREFEQAIETALDGPNPIKDLLNIFDEYRYLFSRRIVLGRSLIKNLPNTSDTLESSSSDDDVSPHPHNGTNHDSKTSIDLENSIDLEKPIFESLLLHLDELNVPYLLTKEGTIIDKDNLSDWTQDTNGLEVIELIKLVPYMTFLGKNREKNRYYIK